MNQIFKVIWNQTTQSWIAVSELASAKSKTKSQKTVSKLTALSGAIGAALFATQTAQAAVFIGSTDADTAGVVSASTAISGGTVAIGNNGALNGVSIGSGTRVTGPATSHLIRNNPENKIAKTTDTSDSSNQPHSNSAYNQYFSQFSRVGTTVGFNNNNLATSGVAVGQNATANSSGVAIGDFARTEGALAVSLGALSWSRNSAVAIGSVAIADGNTALAIGRQTTAVSDFAQAIGNVAIAKGRGALAIGHSARADGYRSIAIGAPDIENAAGTPGASGQSGAAYAPNLQTRAVGIDNLAMMSNAQILGNQSIAIGLNTRANGANLVVMGTDSKALNTSKEIINAIAIGNNATTTENGTITVGLNATTSNDDAIAFGTNATVAGNSSIALGKESNVTGNYSIAVGVGHLVTGNYAGAFGDPNVVSGDRSYAFGNNNTVSGNGTFVLGNNITATAGNNVILGNFSSENSTLTQLGQARQVNTAQVGALSYSGFNGTAGGIVSVGAVGAERQIINVAPGNISAFSTDAINGSQLYFVAETVSNGLSSINSTLGGGAVLNPNGTVSNFSQPLNTTVLPDSADYTAPQAATNVSQAITNLNHYVNAGWIVGNNTGEKVARISPNEQVNFMNGSATVVSVEANASTGGADIRYSVLTDNTTLTVNQNGQLTANITTLTPRNNGTISVPNNANSLLVNASMVADAINNSGWLVSANGTNDSGKREELIKPGQNVRFFGGNNVKIAQDGPNFTFNVDLVNVTASNISGVFAAGKNLTLTTNSTSGPITYRLNDDIEVNTVLANTSITVGQGPGSTVITNGTVANLNDHLTAPVNATSTVGNATSTAMPTNITNVGNQAATVNDVINAGWNLQANGNAVDAVTHANNVNFASSDGSVTITPTTDGVNSTLNFAVNATAIVTATTGNVSANTTTGRAVVGENGVLNTTAGVGNRLATVGDVAETINNTGWLTNVTLANGTATTAVVKPGTQVNYNNGNGTIANVIQANDGSISVSYDVNTTTGAVNPNGTVRVDSPDAYLNAGSVANLINNASFSVNSTVVSGTNGVSTYARTIDSNITAGDTVNLNAGQNIQISGSGNTFNVATTENVVFSNTQVNSTLSIGNGGVNSPNPMVNITSGSGSQTNGTTVTSPSTLNMGNAQLTNVSAGANVYGANVDQNGHPLTAVMVRNADGTSSVQYFTADKFDATTGALLPDATPSTRVTPNNVSRAVEGLADLASSNQTNVMTVADAAKMGWVVSTGDNDYADKVQNANQVDFKAEANTGVTVKGVTNTTTGVREIVVGNDYFKANSTGVAANAAGANSVAIGSNSVANTAGSIAMGEGARVEVNAVAGSVAIGQGAVAGEVHQGAYRIDGSTNVAGVPDANTRVFSVGNATSPAQIQNVAAGVVSPTSTDAVNGSQLYAVGQNVNNLNAKIDDVDKRGRRGTAIAGAIGMLPQPHISGHSMVAVGTTTYRGEQAVALGYSRISDNGKHIIKLSTSSNVSGKKDAMVGASYGYQW